MSRPALFEAVFLFLSLGFRLPRLAKAIDKAKSNDPGRTTARPMFWVMTVGYVVFLALCVLEGQRRLNAFSWAASLSGLILYIGALALREKAMSDLGRFFSPDIEIRRQHRIVREGLYRYVRHPLLACMGWEIVGLGLVFNAYETLLFIGFGFYFPLILLRKWLEERVLVTALGDVYRSYQRDVGAFWPHWNTFVRPPGN